MIKSILSVIWTEIKFFILHIFWGSRFSYKGIQRFSPGTVISLDKGATLSLGKTVRAHTGTRIRVRNNGKVIIGDDVAFNYNCLVTSHEQIEIGSGCEIGPGVIFYDHDHDIHGHSIKEKLFRVSPVKIGNNVWIGSNAIILRGTEIGDNSVIGAGTVVRGGKYPENTMLYSNQELLVKSINPEMDGISK